MEPVSDKGMEHLLTAADLEGMVGEQVTLHGAVARIRRLGWGAFVVLRRHGGLLQCVMGSEGNEALLDSLACEQSVKVTGTLKAARIKDSSIDPRGVELQLESIEVVASPLKAEILDAEYEISFQPDGEEVLLSVTNLTTGEIMVDGSPDINGREYLFDGLYMTVDDEDRTGYLSSSAWVGETESNWGFERYAPFKFFPIDYQGMAGIVPALKANHHISLRGP